MATNFALELNFTEDDLNTILSTGANVVVARPGADGGLPNVAWLVFSPRPGNYVSWVGNYGIYASNSDLVNGVELSMMSNSAFPAETGKVYTLSASGSFGSPAPGGMSGAYTVVNQLDNLPDGYLTMGLCQYAMVNEGAVPSTPTCAGPVLYQAMKSWMPSTDAYLWVQPQVSSGTFLDPVTASVTHVTFGPGGQATLQYNLSTGKFVPAS
jgi:hypothetical protein